ncbi:hypothetical protein N476_08925 [Pseudoalteromonas luteoviolacea H33]|uniref:Uncharacterized protein n=1 Tax=Pseudoalteromonas luteoviolacea H33 TaxID=1365251 RepID=A0A167FYW8_9GAMM|nr:hypothetical protein N476_08925 [Pseudoalteromonas luteoviolacea H33]KZN76695.1 hypothetical protein N477_14715 [Pseudoalteromonas luteoviolacea H33-S]
MARNALLNAALRAFFVISDNNLRPVQVVMLEYRGKPASHIKEPII